MPACRGRCRWVAEVVVGLQILALQQVLGQDGHGHVVQEGVVGFGQLEFHRVVIHHGDLFHVLIVGGVLRLVFRVLDGLDGELYVLGGEFLPIVPSHILTEVEGVGVGVLVQLPGFCQTGHHLVVLVVAGQSVKEQGVDLPVLVQGGVDAGVVVAAIDQGVGFGTAGRGGGRGRRTSAAAGGEGQRQARPAARMGFLAFMVLLLVFSGQECALLLLSFSF